MTCNVGIYQDSLGLIAKTKSNWTSDGFTCLARYDKVTHKDIRSEFLVWARFERMTISFKNCHYNYETVSISKNNNILKNDCKTNNWNRQRKQTVNHHAMKVSFQSVTGVFVKQTRFMFIILDYFCQYYHYKDKIYACLFTINSNAA